MRTGMLSSNDILEALDNSAQPGNRSMALIYSTMRRIVRETCPRVALQTLTTRARSSGEVVGEVLC
jgi:hypothetical protein